MTTVAENLTGHSAMQLSCSHLRLGPETGRRGRRRPEGLICNLQRLPRRRVKIPDVIKYITTVFQALT